MLFPVIALRLRCASTGVFQDGRVVAVFGEFVAVAQGVFVDNESWQVSEVGSRLKIESFRSFRS